MESSHPDRSTRLERLQTDRLRIRELAAGDAPFILELLNDPDWLRHIGDRGVRSLADARRYIEQGPRSMYARHGHGLYCVTRADEGTPLGLCGLLKREELTDPDLGFAFLPAFRRAGYAREAAEAVLADGRARLGLTRVTAIVAPGNTASIRLLEGLGFSAAGRLSLGGEVLRLYALNLPAGGLRPDATIRFRSSS